MSDVLSKILLQNRGKKIIKLLKYLNILKIHEIENNKN